MLGLNREIVLKRLRAAVWFAVAWVVGAGAVAAGAAAPPQLRYVVIITRHGVRSPTWTPSASINIAAEPWPEWSVPPGDLTPHGRVLMQLMGTYYREWLSSEHLLSPHGVRGSRADLHSCGHGPANTRDRPRLGGNFATWLRSGCPFGAGRQPGPAFQPLSSRHSQARLGNRRQGCAGAAGKQPATFLDSHRAAFEALQFVLAGEGGARRN